MKKLRDEIDKLEKQRSSVLKIAEENDGDEEEMITIYKEYDLLLVPLVKQYEILRKQKERKLYSIRRAPQAQLHQGEGLKRHHKTNRWIAHVKAYSKKHNVPYHLAIKQAKATYR